jgi:FAD/FMN-containing dehydrogenase
MAAAGTSWGRYPSARQTIAELGDRTAPLPVFEGNALPYGNGRSYGDSCLNDGGTLLHTVRLDRYVHFDAQAGIIECEAGVLLSDLVARTLPQGWFPAVTPGTKYVTVGGAIANDVHGKNQVSAGNFGEHVLGLELLRSDGERMSCSPTENASWFAATLGGLGLTGLVTRARLQLRPVAGPWVEVEEKRFGSLADFYRLSAEASTDEYSVAWVDCMAKGKERGRGIFTSGNHSANAGPSDTEQASRRRVSLPFTPPFSLVNPLSLRLFNHLHYRRSPMVGKRHTRHFDPFFYPLDAIGGWNRMYGPRGFLQYQCVVPPAPAEDAISEMLERIAAHGAGSFLAVLKNFGNRRSPGMLSFPRPGTTLALDFPNQGERTLRLLSELDGVVLNAGGAVYPAKDARMSAEMFAASFPRLDEFRTFVDPRFSSGLWRRVGASA